MELESATGRDDDAIGALCARCLTGAPLGYFRARLARDPKIPPEGRLVAREGGRIAANVTVFRLSLAFGDARVPCGGIGNVATDPAFRGRGLATALLRRGHELLLRAGVPLAILSTEISAFYRRLGYVPWTRTDLQALHPAGPGEPPGSVRPMEPERDAPALAALRAAYGRRLVGWHDRDPADDAAQRLWTPLYPGEVAELGLVAERDGVPAGCLRTAVDPAGRMLSVLEFAARDAEPAAALAAALARGAAARGASLVRLPAACGELADGLRGRVRGLTRVRNDTLHAAVLDLPGLLEALRPELSRRLAAATPPAAAGSVLLAAGDRAVSVSWRDGEVRIGPGRAEPGVQRAELTAAQWTGVLLGGGPFSAQPFARASRLDENALNVLDALFPRSDVVFWEADAF